MRTVLFVGGGSVGHIAPGIAVAEALKTLRADLTPHFLCSDRPDDAAFLRAQPYAFTVMHAPRVSPLFPVRFFGAYMRAVRLLNELRPVAVFSKGGYVSVPVCMAATLRGIPIVLHESDAVSGYANRLIGLSAKRVCKGFPETHGTTQKQRYTGNPIRNGITEGSREQGLAITGLSGDKPILLVMGGSQGAKAINDAIIANLDALLQLCDIVHMTGRGKHASDDRTKMRGYYATEFATDTLPHFYACADMALSRAGAGSLAELAANNIPSILVPLRGVGHDHQYVNARTVEQADACIYLEQDSLNTQLVPRIRTLLTDTALRGRISRNIAQFHVPEAPSLIAENIAECLAEHGNDE